MPMDFAKYRYVIAVAELRSISKAAEKCSISQPALTRCINRIEAELEIKLFDRSTLPIKLTYAGERYVAGVKNMLAMKHQLDSDMKEISGFKKGRLSIGVPSSFSSVWLPQILPPFLEKYPGIEVQISEGFSQDLEESLIQEKVELIIANPLPITLPGIEYEEILREQLMLVFPQNHPLFRGFPYDPDKREMLFIDAGLLDGHPYVATVPRQGLYKAAKQMFDTFGVKPKAVVETANSSTAVYLASQGLGFAITTVGGYFLRKFEIKPFLCTLYDPPAERTLAASYKKDRPLSLPARHFIDTVKYQAINSRILNVPKFGVSYEIFNAKR